MTLRVHYTTESPKPGHKARAVCGHFTANFTTNPALVTCVTCKRLVPKTGPKIMKHLLTALLLLAACGPMPADDSASGGSTSSTSDASTEAIDSPSGSSSTSDSSSTSGDSEDLSGSSSTSDTSTGDTSTSEALTSSTSGDESTSTGEESTGDTSTGDEPFMGGACWSEECDPAAQPCAAGLICDPVAKMCVAPCVAVALDVWVCVPGQGFGCQDKEEAPGVCKPDAGVAVMCYPA